MTTITSSTAAVAQRYVDAVSANDFDAVGQLPARDVLWHHPVPIRFSAKRGDAELPADGVDVLKVRGDRVVDVRVFADLRQAGNAFWDAG